MAGRVPSGVRHGSEFATEADAIADVLLRRDVPKDVVALERLASNTSENFWLSAELLRDRGLDPQKFLVVQKPYAERRTLATARRRWPAKQLVGRVFSAAEPRDAWWEICNAGAMVRASLVNSGISLPAERWLHQWLEIGSPSHDYQTAG
jgi:uncharacterized SAM-binding protein YcdF (DUF218 family)